MHTMLAITARLFKDNQLVGYRITDGQQELDVTRLQAWMYAKQRQIMNVKAIGNENDASISGTNGFELKSLPQIKWNDRKPIQKNNNYDSRDLRAALINKLLTLKGSSPIELVRFAKEFISIQRDTDRRKELMKKCLMEKANDPEFKQRRRIWSNKVIVENMAIVEDQPVGYTIRNASNEPIEYYRIPITTKSHSISNVVLNPNESVLLSRAEISATMSKPEFSGIMNEFELVVTLKKISVDDQGIDWLYEILRCSFISLMMGASRPKIERKEIPLDDYAKTYLVDADFMQRSANDLGAAANAMDNAHNKGVNLDDLGLGTADDLRRKQAEHQAVANQLRQNSEKGFGGIFNSFKR